MNTNAPTPREAEEIEESRIIAAAEAISVYVERISGVSGSISAINSRLYGGPRCGRGKEEDAPARSGSLGLLEDGLLAVNTALNALEEEVSDLGSGI